MKDSQKYEEAVKELEVLIKDIEDEKISVDELTEKIKRASQLIKTCKEKLFSTEKEVTDILESLNEEISSIQNDSPPEKKQIKEKKI